MGLCASSSDPHDRTITKEMERAERDDEGIFRTLLLGTGESGKSTIFKQIIRLHGGLNEDQREQARTYAKINALEAGISLIRQSKIFVDEGKSDDCAILSENEEAATKLLGMKDNTDEAIEIRGVADLLKQIWQDPGIQTTFKRKAEFRFHVTDNVHTFLDRVIEIFDANYVVTDDDVFRVRIMTTGMSQQFFSLNERFSMLLVDVGGQRSERRKWIKWFDGIDCVLFIVAVSEFDQLLFEDGRTNRYRESIEVWQEVVNQELFAGTNFILFLNKADIFKEKIEEVKIGDYVEEFDGEEHDFESGMEFFAKQYLGSAKDRDISVYYTTATDTDLMENIIDNVKSALLQQCLDRQGLIG